MVTSHIFSLPWEKPRPKPETAEKAREASQVEGIPLEEDECLPATTLATMKESFWKRYHWMPPPEQQPSDKLLSKVKRSLEKKNIEVLNMFQVKSLVNQRQGTTKRRKVAPKIWVGEDPEDDEVAVEDVWAYLDNMFIYMVALAMAGVTAIQPAPTAAEGPSTNSCDYVEFPLDLAWKYHFRAVQTVKKIPERARLPHVSSLDLQERALWCQKYATGTEKLGAIVLQIYTERDVHWAAATLLPSQSGRLSMAPPEPAVAPRASTAAVSAPSGNKLAATFRDGTPLCEAWNQGRCPHQKARNCANGEHRCSHRLKSGRVCGDPNHVGSKCKNRQKA